MHWPQITIIVMAASAFGVRLSNYAHEKTRGAMIAFFSVCLRWMIILFLLEKGDFFG